MKFAIVRAMLRAALPRFLLILALLFTQLGAMTHGISHLMEEHGANASLSHDKHCDLCVEYAQLGSALDSGEIAFHLLAHTDSYDFTSPTGIHTHTPAAYTARAPPLSA